MKIYIVIPEGLSIDEEGNYFASDFYIAALDKLLEICKAGDRIYLAPANNFGAQQPEDYFARDYLLSRNSVVLPEVVDESILREGYLDTLDNAVVLKKHLMMYRNWPLAPVSLICNRPHKWRSYLMFKLCGYQVAEMITSGPLKRTSRQMVRRLWFYNISLAQYGYEFLAIIYNTLKFIFSKSL